MHALAALRRAGDLRIPNFNLELVPLTRTQLGGAAAAVGLGPLVVIPKVQIVISVWLLP